MKFAIKAVSAIALASLIIGSLPAMAACNDRPGGGGNACDGTGQKTEAPKDDRGSGR